MQDDCCHGVTHTDAEKRAVTQRELVHIGTPKEDESERASRTDTSTETQPANRDPPTTGVVDLVESSREFAEDNATQADAHAHTYQPKPAPHKRVAELRRNKKQRARKGTPKRQPERSAYNLRSSRKEIRQG